MTIHLPRQADLFASEIPWTVNRNGDAEDTAPDPFYLGCAGWSLASPVQHAFPSQGSHLERYSRILPAVEINSSFYRPHRAETYARWRDSVPDTFRFSVKIPKSITHRSRLKDAEEELSEFLDQAGNLRHKLGCLLVQLPPSLQFSPSVATDFFNRMRSAFTGDMACEPRHISWVEPEAQALFDRLEIVRVAADPPVVPMPATLSRTNMVYIRLHGNPEIYHSAYSNHYLDRLAIELADHIRVGRRVWCILDNTASGAAVPNALYLAARFRMEARMAMHE
jgi:uncharacterized protein YecE (DUF72 family)